MSGPAAQGQPRTALVAKSFSMVCRPWKPLGHATILGANPNGFQQGFMWISGGQCGKFMKIH